MFQSKYLLKIEGKDNKRFIKQLIKQDIYFENLEFTENNAYIKVDETNYSKIKSIKTIYAINIINIYGIIKIKNIIKKYFLFLISLLFATIGLYTLNNLIFEIEVVHSKKEIRELLYNELSKRNIAKYKIVSSFTKQENIVKDILNNNKNTLEWMELERIGTKYYVRVEERIIKNVKEETSPRHIIAKKDGIIISIEATKGEIVKSINNYVHKGDIIISGFIKKNEDIINIVSAEGIIFAETWYKVSIELPKHYYEEISTGESKNVFKVGFLTKGWNLFDFNNYKNKKISNKISFNDPANILKIGIYKEEELKVIDEIYTTENMLPTAYKIAEDKLKAHLGENDKIISQKKLKMQENNSTIEVTLFYKVYEDITDIYILQENDLPKPDQKEQ